MRMICTYVAAITLACVGIATGLSQTAHTSRAASHTVTSPNTINDAVTILVEALQHLHASGTYVTERETVGQLTLDYSDVSASGCTLKLKDTFSQLAPDGSGYPNNTSQMNFDLNQAAPIQGAAGIFNANEAFPDQVDDPTANYGFRIGFTSAQPQQGTETYKTAKGRITNKPLSPRLYASFYAGRADKANSLLQAFNNAILACGGGANTVKPKPFTRLPSAQETVKWLNERLAAAAGEDSGQIGIPFGLSVNMRALRFGMTNGWTPSHGEDETSFFVQFSEVTQISPDGRCQGYRMCTLTFFGDLRYCKSNDDDKLVCYQTTSVSFPIDQNEWATSSQLIKAFTRLAVLNGAEFEDPNLFR